MLFIKRVSCALLFSSIPHQALILHLPPLRYAYLSISSLICTYHHRDSGIYDETTYLRYSQLLNGKHFPTPPN